MRASRRVFHGVVNKVNYNLHYEPCVHICHEQLIIKLNFQLMLRQQPVRMRNGLAEDIVQKLRLHVFNSAAALHARYRKKVFNKVYEPVRIVVHRNIHLSALFLGKLVFH